MPPEAAHTHFGPLNYAILFSYLAAMLGIGLFFARRQKTSNDYFLAGRRMPWLVVAMSMFASLTSAVTYLGVPGRAFDENIGIFFGVAVSPLVAPVLILTIYPFYQKLRVTTSYEYIDHRFGRGARYAVSGLFVLARLGWMGTVIYAPAMALSVATGIHIILAILLMGLLATAYTVLGGLSAVLWTDVFQFVILLGGAVWVAAVLIARVPGHTAEIFRIAAEAGRLDVLHFKPDLFRMTALAAAVNWFFIFLSDYGTDQITVQRLLAVGDFRGLCKAVIFNSIMDVLIVSLLLFIGLGLLAFYSLNPHPAVETMKPDRVLAFFIMRRLPVGVSGLIITAVFAAAMSSMDSGINSLATVIVSDFLRPLRLVRDAAELAWARGLTLALGALATGMAFYAGRLEGIIQAWSSVMGLFAAPVLGIFMLGVLTRRGSFHAWLIGAAAAVVFNSYIQYFTEIHWVYYFPTAALTTFIVSYLASYLLPEKKDIAHLTLLKK